MPFRLALTLTLLALLAACTGRPGGATQQQSLGTLDQASQVGSRSR